MASTFFLHAEQLVPVDPDNTFAFFADAANLQRLTPPWLDFTITSRLPLAMHQGALIDYKLKVHGIPIRWQSVISERLWRHVHRFTPRSGATLVEDDVHYRVPGGTLANLFVRRDLTQIFGYRQRALLDALAVSSPGPATLAFGTI